MEEKIKETEVVGSAPVFTHGKNKFLLLGAIETLAKGGKTTQKIPVYRKLEKPTRYDGAKLREIRRAEALDALASNPELHEFKDKMIDL